MVIGSLILLYLGKIDLQSRNVEENSQMLLGLMFFLALSGTTAVRAIEPPSNEPTSNYVIHWGIKIPTATAPSFTKPCISRRRRKMARC